LHRPGRPHHRAFRPLAGEPLRTGGDIKGAIAVAVAVTVKTVWTIAHPHFRPGNRIRVVVIGVAAFALHALAGISPVDVLLVAAVIGFFLPAPS
jgi:hypothetical protein